ncbi:MAG: Na/Pi cotransporter family protein, partial [Lachnospiraceae bacterium]|nr:Na/Pi cotransporter family protein [Lachnospiraceae bacterium]
MGISEIVQLFCGIALFLFGMSLMGDGLKKLSGNKLEPVLYRLSNTRPKAVLLGTGVTAVIQSSCATAVMVVGFVNSGMMKVVQGINIILGAILGTSITGWILCLSYIEGGGELKALLSTSTLTGIVAVIGISLRTFGKRQVVKNTGDILLGFSVLMIGMNMMSGAVGGLGDSPAFIKTLSSFSNPLLGILVGALFTALLQSASAAVGILQALSVTGAMTFESALPLLLGVAIGAAAPVLLSSFGANIEGKRTAFIYPI